MGRYIKYESSSTGSKKVKCQQDSALNICIFRVCLNIDRVPLLQTANSIIEVQSTNKLCSRHFSRYRWDERERPAEHCL